MPERVLVEFQSRDATIPVDWSCDIEYVGAAIAVGFETRKHGLDSKFFGSDLSIERLVVDYYWFHSAGGRVGLLNLLKNVKSSLNKGHYKFN